MAVRESQAKYNQKNIKRVPLDMQIEFYDHVKAAAQASGMAVNAYIKLAISEKLKKDL